MTGPTIAPFGTWTSPVSATAVAGGALRLGAIAIDGEDIYWVEGRPSEGGRYVVVRRSAEGVITDVTPPTANVRTRVHEYGGGAYAVANGTVWYVNFGDQRIYRAGKGEKAGRAGELGRAGGDDPVPITPPGDWFYADFAVDLRRQRLICVREDHTDRGHEAVNTLVGISLTGSSSADEVLASGYDFYSTPRLSPDGSMLVWLCWRHPQMPWDGTELWLANVADSGELQHARCIAGSHSESIYQPGWSPDGNLYFVSDRTGWWHLYRANQHGHHERVVKPSNAPNDPNDLCEFGRPQWIFATSTWAFAGPSRMIAAYTRAGRWHLSVIDIAAGTTRDVAPDLAPAEWLAATPTHAVTVAGFATRPDELVRIDLSTGETTTLRAAASFDIDPAYISVPDAIEFPTTDGARAHAFYYAPRNRDFVGPEGSLPPLVTISHGGPTTAAKATFELQVQFWTSRGFAVVDVNYGGSSGYGRAYRQRLNGAWGIVDVADAVSAATFLAQHGRADRKRLIIRGGSAGGYTTLAALVFYPDVFNAAASYYGVSDLEMLALDTHKFESRYGDTLVGPYPERQDLYRARSPIHFIDRLSCPLILFQGLEDKVVPPNQSQMMADAVRAKGLPVAYLAFEGEQHGFRKAETIIRCLEAELSFYGTVFELSRSL